MPYGQCGLFVIFLIGGKELKFIYRWTSRPSWLTFSHSDDQLGFEGGQSKKSSEDTDLVVPAALPVSYDGWLGFVPRTFSHLDTCVFLQRGCLSESFSIWEDLQWAYTSASRLIIVHSLFVLSKEVCWSVFLAREVVVRWVILKCHSKTISLWDFDGSFCRWDSWGWSPALDSPRNVLHLFSILLGLTVFALTEISHHRIGHIFVCRQRLIPISKLCRENSNPSRYLRSC